MPNNVLTMLAVSLLAAFTAQTVTASERHHMRTWDHAVATKQFRNTNAYAAPNYIGVQRDWSNLSEAAQTSGLAGH